MSRRYNRAMQIIKARLANSDLQTIAFHTFGNLVKAVVDIRRKVVAIDAPLHADLEQFLLERGSIQSDLWGINLHPDQYGTDNFIEYDSMINLRPNQNNFTRSVDNPKIQNQISQIVKPIFTN